MFDIPQDVNYGSIRTAKCDSAKDQVAGRYNVKTHVTPGYSKTEYDMQKTSVSSDYYEHTILAKVTNVSPNTVFLGGSTLTITGAGFSTVASEN